MKRTEGKARVEVRLRDGTRVLMEGPFAEELVKRMMEPRWYPAVGGVETGRILPDYEVFRAVQE